MKSVNDTLDDFTGGITVEGALKHPFVIIKHYKMNH